MRSLPAEAASLLCLRENDNDNEAQHEQSEQNQSPGAGFRESRLALERTVVYRLLYEADGLYRKRDGPLALSVGSAAALLLVAPALVTTDSDLHRCLPLSAGMILEASCSEPPAVNGVIGQSKGGGSGSGAILFGSPMEIPHVPRRAQGVGETSLGNDISAARAMIRDMAQTVDCSEPGCSCRM